jgi:hypothetical protein
MDYGWIRSSILLLLFLMWRPVTVMAQEAGTLGFSVVQLYGDAQANKRGVLMVRMVAKGSAAEAAGIGVGDVIVSVNGILTEGHDAGELGRAGLWGTAGESVRLMVVKGNGAPAQMVLTRKPYVPHVNPETDAFRYTIPGEWQMDPRYPFPLPWSPSIAYKGFEDLAFAPGFDDTSSPEYHSYLIVWWLEGTPPISAESLDKEMVAYFRGLAEQRGRNNKFTPDLTKVAASYRADAVPQSFGGTPAKSFAGTVTLYDRHGAVITLHSEVISSVCEAAGHTAVYFAMSKEARPAKLWKQLDAVRDGFRCARDQ